MKHARTYLCSGLLLAGVALAAALTLGNRAEAQSRSTSGAPLIITQGKSTADNAALGSIDAKLNKLLQSQGGRYVFLVSDGELMRLDTQEGKIAMFNIVQGAGWDTLQIPERSIGPGNAFYEKYVQFLDKTNFDNN